MVRTLITLFTSLAIATGTIAALLNKKESWSQLHLTVYDPLLNFILGCIYGVFLLAFAFHPDKEKEITKIKWLNLSIKLKWAFFTTAMLFLLVLTFGVNHQSKFIGSLHIIFTGLAILSSILTMVLYPETKKGHLWANTGALLASVGFILGYVFKIYSTAWAEVIVAFIFGTFLFVTFNIKKKIITLAKKFKNEKTK